MGEIHGESEGLEPAPGTEVPATVAAAATPASRRFILFGGGALVALLVPVFVSLGQWQWHKAEAKKARQELLDTRAAEAPLRMTSLALDPETVRYRRVVVRGVYEPQRQILIDNRVHREQAGYHVVTPLRIVDSGGAPAGEGTAMRVLVNRGWVPAGPDRRQLPPVETPAGVVELQATAVLPGTRFFTLMAEPADGGWASPGIPVWQNLDLARYRKAVESQDYHLQPVILQLDPASAGGGFVRDWPRPDERIERHIGYAWQWFGFAAATVGIWLFFLLRPLFGRR